MRIKDATVWKPGETSADGLRHRFNQAKRDAVRCGLDTVKRGRLQATGPLQGRLLRSVSGHADAQGQARGHAWQWRVCGPPERRQEGKHLESLVVPRKTSTRGRRHVLGRKRMPGRRCGGNAGALAIIGTRCYQPLISMRSLADLDSVKGTLGHQYRAALHECNAIIGEDCA